MHVRPQGTPHDDDRVRTGPSYAAIADVSAAVGRAVWTVKETAHLLSLSLGSTYTLIRSGEIPAKKVGNRWLIPKRRLQDWLDSNNVGAIGGSLSRQ